MEIRRATLTDAPAVASCVVEAFKDYMPLIGRTPSPMLEDYYEAIQQHPTFVALDDQGAPTGMLLLKDAPGSDYILLDILAIFPHAQGQGIGRALVAYAEAYIRGQGKQECRLYTHVKYESNITLYHRLGYETYDRKQDGGYDRYYMKKSL